MRQARLPRVSREKALPDVALPESVFLSCRRPPPPATSPADSLRPAGRSGPSAFQMNAFAGDFVRVREE